MTRPADRKKTSRLRLSLPRAAVSSAFLGMMLLAGTAGSHQSDAVQLEAITARIRENPADASLYLRRGEILSAAGAWKAARADFRKALKTDPARVEALFLEGRAMLAAGRPGEAASAVEAFLKQRPGDPGAMLVLARAKAAAGDSAEAARLYSEAVPKMDVSRPEHYLEWAGVRGMEPVEAVKILDAGIARLGPVVTLELPALDLERRLGRKDEALIRADRLLAAAPRKDRWLALKAEVLREAAREEEARRALIEALSIIEGLPENRRRSAATAALEARIRKMLAVEAGSPTGAPDENPEQVFIQSSNDGKPQE